MNLLTSLCSFSDDTPLIRDEFFTSEALVGPHDLGAEHILGVAIDEYDSWSPSVPKEVVKSLKDKQVKRQEHIYEFLMTEKHHCQTLLVMQKVFVDSLQRHFNNLNLERMFPRLHELTELHLGYDDTNIHCRQNKSPKTFSVYSKNCASSKKKTTSSTALLTYLLISSLQCQHKNSKMHMVNK